MKEEMFFSYYYKYSLLCAIAYCIPVYFFFQQESFSNIWVLYLGNSLFTMLLLISGIFVNKKLNDYASLRSMMLAGIKVIVSSILIICVITGILMIIFHKGSTVSSAPDKTDSLLYILIPDAILVNFLIGMFAVGIGAVTIKQNQKNGKGQEIT